MGSFSGLGIALSFVFGCILLGLVAELYYLLWWKKRITNSDREIEEFSFLFCWKRPNSFNSSSSCQELTNTPEIMNGGHEQEDLEMGSSKELALNGYGEGGIETELIRMHSLCGPPRFLFTIKEENKEDLESDDGKSRGDSSRRKGSRTRSLSDLFFAVDTTPLSSPPMKSPDYLDSYVHGFNPLFESLTEAELNRFRSSPPPKFKFLKDAEDKLIRRLVEEAERKRVSKNERSVVNGFVINDSQDSSMSTQEQKDDSFVSFISKSSVRDQIHNQASQVIPLASSPTFEPVLDKKSSVKSIP